MLVGRPGPRIDADQTARGLLLWSDDAPGTGFPQAVHGMAQLALHTGVEMLSFRRHVTEAELEPWAGNLAD